MTNNFKRVNYSPRTKGFDGSLNLSKSGRIGLNSHFVETYNVTSKNRAALYWDDDTNRIAITSNVDTIAYPIGTTGGKPTYINAARFFKINGIDPSEHVGLYKYDVTSARKSGIADVETDVFILTLPSASSKQV